VHLYGCMCDMDAVMGIAERHGLKVLEDAAHQQGSRWKDVGAGALGHALVHYESFRASQLHIVAVFDTDRTKIGQELGNVIVQPLDELASTIIARHIEIAILAVPAESAQEVADLLVAARVRSILNYAPITLTVPPEVHVQYIDPVSRLQHITYYLR